MSMGTGVLLAEALTLGVKAGVELGVLADVINNSSGGSKRLSEKFHRYLFKGNFEPGFATALAAKDVRLATDLGREYGVPMDLSNLVDQRHVDALFRGWGPEDSAAGARITGEKAGGQPRPPRDAAPAAPHPGRGSGRSVWAGSPGSATRPSATRPPRPPDRRFLRLGRYLPRDAPRACPVRSNAARID